MKYDYRIKLILYCMSKLDKLSSIINEKNSNKIKMSAKLSNSKKALSSAQKVLTCRYVIYLLPQPYRGSLK